MGPVPTRHPPLQTRAHRGPLDLPEESSQRTEGLKELYDFCDLEENKLASVSHRLSVKWPTAPAVRITAA